MVVFAALHMGWLKFLAVFLKERIEKKKKGKIETCVIVSVQFKDFEAVSEG